MDRKRGMNELQARSVYGKNKSRISKTQETRSEVLAAALHDEEVEEEVMAQMASCKYDRLPAMWRRELPTGSMNIYFRASEGFAQRESGPLLAVYVVGKM